MVKLCYTIGETMYYVEGDFYSILQTHQLLVMAGIPESHMCVVYNGNTMNINMLFNIFTNG